MKTTIIFLLTLLSITTFAQQKNSLDKTIYTIMDQNAESLFKSSKAYSVSIGIVKDGKTYTKHYGEIDKGKGNQANNETYFEVASVTKVMTGYLLAKAVLEKKISLNDDIRKYLKGDYPNLEYDGTPVRIKDLISYESAIPSAFPDDREIRKTFDDSTTFRLNKIYGSYSIPQFLKDLRTVKLDTLPGTKYLYSNPSLELTGLILENIYGKPYETLLKENLWSKLNMNHTKFTLNSNEHLANGYNNNHVLMPNFISNLWGSAGTKTKSTMGDLIKLLQFELNQQNSIVQESQRNIKDSKEIWFGYFWDNIFVTENGKFCYKHGGAYGHQTLFGIYPEQNLGICIIVNISGPETHNILFNAVFNIANVLTSPNTKKQENYGYYLKNDKVVFQYKHQKNLNVNLINKVSLAGSFNEWNPENANYQLSYKGNNLYELEIPKSKFETGKTYSFKFVINNVVWAAAPKNASNTDKSQDNNLTFRID